MIKDPTPYPDVNDMIRKLFAQAQAVLGEHLVGMYLDGSLTSGDFDADSDIDFVVVCDDALMGELETTEELFGSLRDMHDRLAQIDSPWAIQLEGSYISQHALRRYDPEHCLYPNIERGIGERLKPVRHDEMWDVHRYVLRERGIALFGPEARALIDPVSPDRLREAMRPVLDGWASSILSDPALITHRGYQSYIVLTLCRILYTLENGAVVSKPTAARWAKETLGERWAPLIERAWAGRHGPGGGTAPLDGEVQETMAMIRYIQDRSQQFQIYR